MCESEYVYFEGDNIGCIYFIKEGNCGFVLPSHSNAKYIDIGKGSHFGVHDIIGYIYQSEDEIDFENWINQKERLTRQFTVMSETKSQLYSLSIVDLNRMKLEFLDSFEEIFTKSIDPLVISLVLKLRAIRQCQKTIDKVYKNTGDYERRFKNIQTDGSDNKLSIEYNLKVYTLK